VRSASVRLLRAAPGRDSSAWRVSAPGSQRKGEKRKGKKGNGIVSCTFPVCRPEQRCFSSSDRAGDAATIRRANGVRLVRGRGKGGGGGKERKKEKSSSAGPLTSVSYIPARLKQGEHLGALSFCWLGGPSGPGGGGGGRREGKKKASTRRPTLMHFIPIYETLIQRDDNMHLKPGLAVSWRNGEEEKGEEGRGEPFDSRLGKKKKKISSPSSG